MFIMEQNTFTDKLQIPSVNFENKDIKTFSNTDNLNNSDKKINSILEGKLEEKNENKEFNIHNYKWVIIFVVVIILFLLFINGMSVYKNNLFIN